MELIAGIEGTIIVMLIVALFCVYRKNGKLKDLQKDLVNVEQLQLHRDAYRRSQRDMKQIIDSLPWPMFIINPKELSISYGNDVFKKSFRFETVAAEEFCIWKIMPERQSNGRTSVECIGDFVSSVRKSPAMFTEEQEYLMPSGEIVLMRTVGSEIHYNGSPSVSVVLQDISVQKKEAELLRSLADKEREANELKSRFIINMSHEIRTPMNGIIGLADIQLQKAYEKETRDAFKKISLSAKLLLAIVNDILDYSKIDAGKLNIIEEEFILESIIFKAMQTAFERVGDKKVEMLLQMEDDVPRKVIGDAVRVWQILQNVLDNSAKYTERGSIMLRVSLESIDEEKQLLLFRIADTGIGMNKEQLDKAYVPFEQFNASDWKNSGTGLGLPVTKHLVELMGGSIAMQSQEGWGTVTEIRIPLRISEWPEPAIDKSAFVILKDKRILIVDDAAAGAEVLAELLNGIGSRAEVSRPETVMDRIREQAEEYNIIVLDSKLDQLTLKIFRSYPFTKSKLIILQKPYKPTQFLERLCALLGGVSPAYSMKNKKYHFPKARVLICEDNAINQDVIVGVLELFSIQSVVAVNGEEGIKWLEKEEFDLVIMDLLMPVMDGHEATRTIRGSGKAYQTVPIIAMTANAMDEEMAICLEEGMNGYVTKPIELDRLYHELLKWLPVSSKEEVLETSSQNLMEIVCLEEEDESQKAELEKLGIDVEEATARFAGKYETYCKSLRKFAVDIERKGMMDVARAAESDQEELRRYIHGLKGVTANLSIKEENRLLQEVERSIKSGTPDIGLYRQFYHRMLRLSPMILAIIGEERQKALEAGSWEECKLLLTELKKLLLLAKARECEQLVERIRAKTWENIDAELLEKICDTVEEYDYSKTLTILEKLV